MSAEHLPEHADYPDPVQSLQGTASGCNFATVTSLCRCCSCPKFLLLTAQRDASMQAVLG